MVFVHVAAFFPGNIVRRSTGTFTAFCSSDESPPVYSHSSKYAYFKVSPVGIQNTYSRALWDTFPFSLGFKSTSVAPLPQCSRNVLVETVKTFAVFPQGCTFSMVKIVFCANTCFPSWALHPLRRRIVPCQVGFVNGSPSGSQSKIRSRSDVPSERSSTAEDPMVHDTHHSEFIPVTPRAFPLHYLGRP